MLLFYENKPVVKKTHNLIQEVSVSGKSRMKVLLVFAAFFVMVVSSCSIMHRTLSQKLLNHAEASISDIRTSVSNMISGPEVALNFFADTIQEMMLRGESLENIEAYLTASSTDEFKKKIRTFSYHTLYGYFDIFGAFSDGQGWAPSADYLPQERPWYTMAVAAGGKAVISPVHIDTNLKVPVVFYSRALLNADNRVLGVAAMSVPIDFTQPMVSNEHISKNSYSFAVNDQLIVVMHPNKEIIGELMGTANLEMAQFRDAMRQGLDINKENVRNYQGVKSVIFGRQIDHGWYVTLVVPEEEYYKQFYQMTMLVSLLGILMASGLSILLVRIDIAKNRSDLQNQQKSNFLTIMSHEIRTPMNAIMGIAEAQLLDQDETVPSGIREAFDRIYYSGNLLLQIISDLLDLSKAEAGKLDIRPERYEIASLINEVVHLNKIRFDSKPVGFKLQVDENIPKSLVGDELRIKQILNNLLSNAFKYTWRGEVRLSITSEPCENIPEEVMLVFTVSDTGQGIATQDLEHLFTEFTRFNLNANRSVLGAGLGLNITQSLVDMMQGEIIVESELEKGTTFTVRLPQKLSGVPPAVLGKELAANLEEGVRFSNSNSFIQGLSHVSKFKKPPLLREPMPYGRVLIVDDVEMNLFVAKLLMRPYDLQIDTASSGYEAIDRIKGGEDYDIVFIDHMMPKMDGMETTRKIRDLGYTRPVVAFTANAMAGQADFFLSNGFDDFISKPIDIHILNAVLKKYIRNKFLNNGPPRKNEEGRAEDSLPFTLPGLDVRRGLEVFGGETADYISALYSFLKSAPESMDKLDGVTEENLSEYAINMHSLKSISSWICAENIRAGAERLEALAKDGDISGVLARNEALLKEAGTFLKELKAMLEEKSKA